MANETLNQLAKIVSTDKYDIAAGDRIKKLQEKWDLLEAKENLHKHLVIEGFVDSLKDWAKNIDETLRDMDVVDENTKLFRFKLKAEKKVIEDFMSIFDPAERKALENSIKFHQTTIKNNSHA